MLHAADSAASTTRTAARSASCVSRPATQPARNRLSTSGVWTPSSTAKRAPGLVGHPELPQTVARDRQHVEVPRPERRLGWLRRPRPAARMTRARHRLLGPPAPRRGRCAAGRRPGRRHGRPPSGSPSPRPRRRGGTRCWRGATPSPAQTGPTRRSVATPVELISIVGRPCPGRDELAAVVIDDSWRPDIGRGLLACIGHTSGIGGPGVALERARDRIRRRPARRPRPPGSCAGTRTSGRRRSGRAGACSRAWRRGRGCAPSRGR